MVIADLNQQGADAAAKELDPSGKRAVGVAMDVTSEPQVEAGMAKAIAAFGRLDILVSNAGIQIVAPLDEFEFAKWKQLLAIHLDGAFLTTRAALRQIYKQGAGGSIIYMGSVHSKEADGWSEKWSKSTGLELAGGAGLAGRWFATSGPSLPPCSPP